MSLLAFQEVGTAPSGYCNCQLLKVIDHVESTLQNRLCEILSSRSDFSADALDQVSQEVFNSFVTVKQFYQDALTRAQATQCGAWTDLRNDGRNHIKGLMETLDPSWTLPTCNTFSPLQSFPEDHAPLNRWRGDKIMHETLQ